MEIPDYPFIPSIPSTSSTTPTPSSITPSAEPPAPPQPPTEPPEDNIRKYRLAALYSAVFLAVVLIVCLCLWGFRQISAQPAESSSLSSAPASTEYSVVPTFTRILGQWEGKLAVFSEDQPVPDEVFDVFIASLPQEEQDKLREGIRINDETELASYLEDYTS